MWHRIKCGLLLFGKCYLDSGMVRNGEGMRIVHLQYDVRIIGANLKSNMVWYLRWWCIFCPGIKNFEPAIANVVVRAIPNYWKEKSITIRLYALSATGLYYFTATIQITARSTYVPVHTRPLPVALLAPNILEQLNDALSGLLLSHQILW